MPKTDVAAELGVSTDAIAETVRVATIGDIGANLAKFNAGDRQVPIRVQLRRAARAADRQLLETLKVATDGGCRRAALPRSPTSSSARARPPSTATTARAASLIEADLVGNAPLGDAVERGAWPCRRAKNLPPGVELKQSGDAEIMGEVFEGFAQAMGAGLMMVYAVLVLLFGSFLQPITILFSLPLSIGGAILALAITSKPISLPVVIGILMLMGIVTKNAIMLVDFAVEEMRARRAARPRPSSMPAASARGRS